MAERDYEVIDGNSASEMNDSNEATSLEQRISSNFRTHHTISELDWPTTYKGHEDVKRLICRMRALPPLSGSGVFDLSADLADSFRSTDLTESFRANERKVRFLDCQVTKEIPRYLSGEDIAASWLSGEDYTRIQAENMSTVDLVNKGESLSTDDHCVRGLESHFDDESSKKSKEEVIGAILDRQVDLWSEGQIGEQERLLAETYCIHSTEHAFRAIAAGLNDRKAIEDESMR